MAPAVEFPIGGTTYMLPGPASSSIHLTILGRTQLDQDLQEVSCACSSVHGADDTDPACTSRA